MSRIEEAFKNGKAFISFITGGDPDLETSKELIIAMEEAGADLIEIGVPFSDPIAEGIVIQDANIRALNAGCTTDKLFDMVEEVRKTVEVPLVFLTYLNPIYTYGKERFMNRCRKAGIDGIIVPDLPFEEKDELDGVCKEYGVDLISLIAPTSNERITKIAKEASGFIYCVSSLGVTGVRSNITTDIGAMTKLVREATDIPCAVGFGIAKPEQAANVCKYADGAIVGSAIVKIVVVDMAAIMEQIQTAATAWAFDAPLPVTTRGVGTSVSSPPKLEDIQNSNTYITYDPARRVLTIQVEPDARGVIPSAYLKFKDGSTQKIHFEACGRFFRAEVHNLTDGEYELLLEKG